jgi:hypothetical protein
MASATQTAHDFDLEFVVVTLIGTESGPLGAGHFATTSFPKSEILAMSIAQNDYIQICGEAP